MTDQIHERVLQSELGVSITTLRRWLRAYAHGMGDNYTQQAYVSGEAAEAMRKLHEVLRNKIVHNIDDGVKFLLGRYTPPLDSAQTNQLYEGIVDIKSSLERLHERDAGDIVAVDRPDWDSLMSVIAALVDRVEETNARLDKQATYLREVLPHRTG